MADAKICKKTSAKNFYKLQTKQNYDTEQTSYDNKLTRKQRLQN